MKTLVYFSLVVCCFSTFISGISFMDAMLKDEKKVPKLALWSWYISLASTCAIFIGITL